MWWDVTPRPSIHTHSGLTVGPSRKMPKGKSAHVKKKKERIGVFALLSAPVPFHLGVRGQQRNQSQLPSVPRWDTFSVCLPLCAFLPLQRSIFWRYPWLRMRCGWLFRCARLHVCSPPQRYLPLSPQESLIKGQRMFEVSGSSKHVADFWSELTCL